PRPPPFPPRPEPGLDATRFYDPIRGTFAAGAQAAIVQVEPETGAITIRRWVCVEDTGRVINPLIVEGQVHGAIAQGIGGALAEHLIYDDAGQLLTGTFMEYAVPTASVIPRLAAEHVGEPAANLAGGRVLGEGGTRRPAPSRARSRSTAGSPPPISQASAVSVRAPRSGRQPSWPTPLPTRWRR